MGRGTVGAWFDARTNALNLVRLLLAGEVLLWHAYSLRGGEPPEPVAHFLADVGVDGFFAVSGFLICRSWLQRPQLGPFLLARGRRILPGLWVCLVVTALVICPLAVLAAGDNLPTIGDRLGYVWANAAVDVRAWGVGGSPHGLEDPAWNGSLWTLVWEVYCYLAVALLGVLGLLRARLVAALAIGFWAYALLVEVAGVETVGAPTHLWMPQRAGLMFALGALLWFYRDRVPVSSRLAVAAAVAVPLGVAVFTNYRLLAAPAVAYLVIYAALRLGQRRQLRLRHDVSYGVYVYAFPLQQALLLVGLGGIGWAAFSMMSIAVVVPIAAASWFLVEQPALRRQLYPPKTRRALTGGNLRVAEE